MTDPTQTDPTDARDQAATESTSASPAAQTAPDASPTDTAKAEPTEALQAEVASLKDRMLRTLAEMENMRRRTEKEVSDARSYAISNFGRDILTVADNVRRALDSVPSEAREGAQGPLKALIEGIELTERDLLNTMERHGIRKIEPKGERFDPNLHQAMLEMEDASVPSGTVVQVVQSGYVIGERVLRPALVGVAKGGPKTA
jgi:molecular chaperone GrpE